MALAIGLGVTKISPSTGWLSAVKLGVTRLDRDECRRLVVGALASESIADIRRESKVMARIAAPKLYKAIPNFLTTPGRL